MGETVLRPFAIHQAKHGGKFEYSRYDYVLERAVIRDFLRSQNRTYHFVYAEKSFHLLEKYAGRNGHHLIGTVHHPPEHAAWLFNGTDHFRCFDQLIVMDPDSIAFWQSVTQRDNVQWLPHGIDTDYFCPIERNTDHHPRRIVFAGTHERDFDTLRSAVTRFSDEQPNVAFDLIGRHEAITDLADRHDNVTQHINVSDAEYLKIIQEADIVYLPLRRSTVCNAVLEGMACGLGIVTSEGGVTAYLSNDMSVVAPVSDTDASVHALRSLLDRPRAELRTAALRQAQRFAWPAVARQHVELYAEVADLQPASVGSPT